MNLIRVSSTICCSLFAIHAQAAWVNINELHAVDPGPGTSGAHFGTSIAADVRSDGSIRAFYVGVPDADVCGTWGQRTVHVASVHRSCAPVFFGRLATDLFDKAGVLVKRQPANGRNSTTGHGMPHHQ